MAGFSELAETFGPEAFDAVTCLGNSLAHLQDKAAMQSALKDIQTVLAPGGTALFQMRNYVRVLAQREKFMPLNSWAGVGEEMIFLRMTEFPENTGSLLRFSIQIFHKQKGKWDFHVETETLYPWQEEEIVPFMRGAGFENIELFGSYQGDSYDPRQSADLIIAARKV